MDPWIHYMIKRLELEQFEARAARRRLLERAARSQPHKPPALDRLLVWFGRQLVQLGRRLQARGTRRPRISKEMIT